MRTWGSVRPNRAVAQTLRAQPDSSDRELASLIFSIFVLGVPTGFVVGCIVFLMLQ